MINWNIYSFNLVLYRPDSVVNQTGYIPGRQYFFSMLRLLNVRFSTHSTKEPEGSIFLDAKKAFDRIEWQWLISCTYLFICLLRLSTNGIIFDYYNLHTSTFLSDIVAIALVSDLRIWGIGIKRLGFPSTCRAPECNLLGRTCDLIS